MKSTQAKLINIGVGFRGYIVLNYIKDNFITESIKGIELQNSNPLFFKNSADVKNAFDELTNSELINAEFNNGNIENIELNYELIRFVYKVEDVIISKEKIKKTKKDSIKIESQLIAVMNDIVSHYNNYSFLPRPSKLTDTNKEVLKSKLNIFSPETIKDAITYVSTQNWVLNKADENWLNMCWILRNIEGFMEGGKYRNNKSNVSSNIDLSKLREDKEVMFL